MIENTQSGRDWFSTLKPYFPHFIDHVKLSGCLFFYNTQKPFIDHIPFAALPYRFSRK